MPKKLLLFTVVAGLCYLYLLPKRAQLVSSLLQGSRQRAAEDSLHGLIEERIRLEICAAEDLCEYRPLGWEKLASPDKDAVSFIHAFTTDSEKRRFLFRIRSGRISEIIDLR